MNDLFDPEKLRPAQYAFTPDPRTLAFKRINFETREERFLTIDDYHKNVEPYELHEGVPENVRIHFDTARNIYLYAWLVYRFYPVAEHHAYISIEYALREKIGEECGAHPDYPGKKPTLKPLLRYAIDHELLKNENFEAYRSRGEIRSRQRYEMEKRQEMQDKGLSEITLDYSEVEITEEDLADYDYLEVILEAIPNLRNDYSHGSSTLHNHAINGIKIAWEIISQLYDRPA